MTGKRLDFGDPFRIIRGEGLGLALARAMIEAHEGRLTHSCEQDGAGPAEARTPYRVRFTIQLPTRWRRR
jgi:K+-sensing histidine kinase KdpD